MDIAFLNSSQGRRIAYRRREGGEPTLVFLPGYASDMEGAKALAVDTFAREQGVGMLRFDYSGTGSSEDSFDRGTLDGWLDESLEAIDQLTEGELILVGSSMGGWLALLIAMRRADRVCGIVGIAAAPDFTEWGFGADDRATLERDGRIAEPNEDGSPGRYFTRAFWESGQQLRLLGSPVEVHCPVRLVHGDADAAVPLAIATQLTQQLRSADVQLTIIKGGGHRLSAPHEIATILRVLGGLISGSR